jgi:signal transduction histidine kinase
MRKAMEWLGGDVTGMLPYSRMTTPPGDTIAEEPGESVMIPRDNFPGLIRNCQEVTAALVHVMTDRARRFTSTDLRDEKMISLGKLAAGFAHEVNNPASAALRDAKSLESALTEAEESVRLLCASGLSGTEMTALETLWTLCKTSTSYPPTSGLELADREDSIAAWLTVHGIAETLAEELARTAATTKDLQNLAEALTGKKLDAALRWIAGAFSARSLASDIERAAARIHTLVAAAKGFTHMDRSPDIESVDVSKGLADTVALLEGRAKERSVQIMLDIPEGLPPIRGHTVEINQIWMNLIDNAIDAAPEHSHVSVAARMEGADIIVSVVDNGSGIPADIRQSIFDPFFTTKPVGEGSGLGLDIVRRVVDWHNGDVSLDTAPGRTEFRVRLPIGGPG